MFIILLSLKIDSESKFQSFQGQISLIGTNYLYYIYVLVRQRTLSFNLTILWNTVFKFLI